jgi:hypothetical protein
VGLERSLGDGGAVAGVLEVACDPLVVHHAARRRDVALLHRENDIVLERLRASLHEQVVSRKAGTADTKADAADHVLDLVGDGVLALALGDRLEVAAIGIHYRFALVVVEPAHAG